MVWVFIPCQIAKISSHLLGWLIPLVLVSFDGQKLFNLMLACLSTLPLSAEFLESYSRKSCVAIS
jgi:hypothetical protein